MAIFIITCEIEMYYEAEVDIDLNLPEDFDPKNYLPSRISQKLMEMDSDGEIAWTETGRFTTFYED